MFLQRLWIIYVSRAQIKDVIPHHLHHPDIVHFLVSECFKIILFGLSCMQPFEGVPYT